MKKIFTLAMLLVTAFASKAQILSVNYRGAFAPSPTPMWTDNWTNWDPQNTVYPTKNVVIGNPTSGGGVISSNTTWTNNNVYEICGLIYVKDGVTLTIQAGTVILGSNRFANSALVVTKGGKLIAIGTANQPIVFTSEYPAGFRAPGNWGGVILLGKASLNATSSATSPNPNTYGINYIEGITETNNSATTGESTEFGGGATPDDNDNSGTLSYIRIEFGGYIFSQNKEINGLTFGAVGRGTTVNHIQCSFINDDAFEWFGGTINCDHLVSYRGVDDEWDTDNGFSGAVQFCLGVRDPLIADNSYSLASSGSTSEGYESDNDANGSDFYPRTKALFTNITNIGPLRGNNSAANQAAIHPAFRRVARIRRNSELKIFNSILADYPTGVMIDNALGNSAQRCIDGLVKVKNNIISGVAANKLTESAGTLPAGFTARGFVLDPANANDSTGPSTGFLVKPYGVGTYPTATTFTQADYRPTPAGLAASGADFTDSSFTLHGWTLSPCGTPSAAGAITGAKNINQCDSMQTYSVTAVAGVSYFWSVTGTGNSVQSGQGTNSVVLKMKIAGTISVVGYNNCGSSAASTQAVVKAVPLTPGVIQQSFVPNVIAKTNICLFDNSAFAVTGVADTFRIKRVANAVGYIWETPAGSTVTNVDDTTIAVVFADGLVLPQFIKVYTKSACDTSLAKSLTLTRVVAALPGTIQKGFFPNITAVTNVCSLVGGGTETYKIRKVVTATSYLWSLAFGINATITHLNAAGPNDTAITVTYNAGFTKDSIRVRSVNGCTTSAFKKLLVTALLVPPTPNSIVSGTASFNACIGNVISYTASAPAPTAVQTTVDHYRWTVPAHTSITGTNADSSTITVTFLTGYTGGSLNAKAVSPCGTATATGKVQALTHTGCPVGTIVANGGIQSRGVATENKVVSANVYPNPNDGNFTLNIKTGVQSKLPAMIQIIDMFGKVIAQFDAVNDFGTINKTVSENRLVSGVYTVKYTVGSTTNSIRMVVQK